MINSVSKCQALLALSRMTSNLLTVPNILESFEPLVAATPFPPTCLTITPKTTSYVRKKHYTEQSARLGKPTIYRPRSGEEVGHIRTLP